MAKAPCGPRAPRNVAIVMLTAVGDAVHEPAQDLLPERLVALVLERDVRVHLPKPGVLHRERDRLAAAVALEGEHDLLTALAALPGEQRRRARADLAELVHGGHGGEGGPAVLDLVERGVELHRRVGEPRRSGRDLHLGERSRAGRRRGSRA